MATASSETGTATAMAKAEESSATVTAAAAAPAICSTDHSKLLYLGSHGHDCCSLVHGEQQ